MPFFIPAKYIIDKGCVSLQVQKPKKYLKEKNTVMKCRKKGRVYLPPKEA